MSFPKKLIKYAIIVVCGYIFIKHILIHLLVSLAALLLVVAGAIALVYLALPEKKKEHTS